jgi:hypothetical protein
MLAYIDRLAREIEKLTSMMSRGYNLLEPVNTMEIALILTYIDKVDESISYTGIPPD